MTRRGPRILAAAMVVLVLAAGCAGGGDGGAQDGGSGSASSGSSGSGGSGSSNEGPVSIQDDTYGLAPQPNPDVTYQPDVVIVGGGSSSVRSVSGDGITWTIDAGAENADKLQPGSIMFLTSTGVGRVAEVVRTGDDLAVSLLPVNLTDVIQDADLRLEQPVDPDNFAARTTPDLPGALSVPRSGGEAGGEASGGPGRSVSVRRPVQVQVLDQSTSTGTIPPAQRGGAVEYSVGGWRLEPSLVQNQAGLKIGYDVGGVVFGGEATVEWDNPRYVYDLKIVNGKVVGGRAALYGVKTIGINVQSGSSVGVNGNVKARLELPIEHNETLFIDGLPLNVSFRFKFIVETAFSAKNSTVLAKGRYRVSGPIGFEAVDGSPQPLVPTITEEKSLLESLEGISVGANGLVFAFQLKVIGGLGLPFAMVGPYAFVTVSTGLTIGSDLGIVKCRQVYVRVDGGGGVGGTISEEAMAFAAVARLAKLIGIDKLKIDVELGGKQTYYQREFVAPQVPVCLGDGGGGTPPASGGGQSGETVDPAMPTSAAPPSNPPTTPPTTTPTTQPPTTPPTTTPTTTPPTTTPTTTPITQPPTTPPSTTATTRVGGIACPSTTTSPPGATAPPAGGTTTTVCR